MDAHLRSADPLGFTDLKEYPARVRAAEKKVGRNDAVASGFGTLDGLPVCLAVWLTFAARTAAGKILAILWPITAFVLLGLEHSVANMYFFPQGWQCSVV